MKGTTMKQKPMRQKMTPAQKFQAKEKMKKAPALKKMAGAVAMAKKAGPSARPKPAAGRKPKQRLS